MAQDSKRQGRPPAEEPKCVPATVRMTRAMADAVDEARGETPRSVWIEQAVAARLAREADVPLNVGGIEVPLVVSDRQPPGTVTMTSARREDGKLKVSAASAVNVTPDCPHPKARINKGLCGACGTYVGKQAT